MSWMITITFEKQSELLDFLAAQAGKDVTVRSLGAKAPKAEKKTELKQYTQTIGPDCHLSLGPNVPTAESFVQMIKVFGKLEVKHGAHNVTRRILVDAMKKAKFSDWIWKSGISTALNKGYLEASEEI